MAFVVEGGGADLTNLSRHNMAWRERLDVGREYTQVDGLVGRCECGVPSAMYRACCIYILIAFCLSYIPYRNTR